MATSCFKCGMPTGMKENLFCDKCIPKYGDIVKSFTNQSILFVGSIPLLKVLKYYRTHKIIKWWMGTDILTMYMVPPGKSSLAVYLHRLKMKLLEPIIDYHFFVSEKLMSEAKFIKNNDKCVVFVHQAKSIKKDGKPFVVGYYLPESSVFNDWVYGEDMINDLIRIFSSQNILFLCYDGKSNIKIFLNIIDVYIRPSEHDGTPRLILLCQQNNIPYCWSNNIVELIRFISNRQKEMKEK